MNDVMIPLYLQPVDVWLFRDGKPFSAGGDHFAESMFPPLPTVIQGALRAHYLSLKKVPLGKGNAAAIQAAVGTGTDYKSLRIRGPFIRRSEDVYYALPADVIYDTTTSKWDSLYPRPASPGVQTSAVVPRLLVSDAEPDKRDYGSCLLSQIEMDKYLSGKPFTATDERFFEREMRIGIAQEGTKRVTKRGALYAVNFIRMCEETGIYVEFSGLPGWDATQGVMRLGGEGHGAYFRQAKLALPLATPKVSSRCFKLVFITPTYFATGWQPDDWNRFFTGGNVKLEAAALHRYVSAGGYDLAKNLHKPALRYVPAGSVYYFSAETDVALKNDWVCDPSPDGAALGQIGFGQVLVGGW